MKNKDQWKKGKDGTGLGDWIENNEGNAKKSRAILAIETREGLPN